MIFLFSTFFAVVSSLHFHSSASEDDTRVESLLYCFISFLIYPMGKATAHAPSSTL